jgi:hypothetical protein
VPEINDGKPDRLFVGVNFDGHDLFVVWTRHYIDPTDGGLRSLHRDADEIILKLKWDVRL